MLRVLLIATALLLSTGASPASPRHPTPAQWKDIRTYGASWRTCGGFDGDESSFREAYRGGYTYAELKNFCSTADRLGKKLKAQGFCLVGKGGVGRAGKGHCYELGVH
jgi:hypothetical protein